MKTFTLIFSISLMSLVSYSQISFDWETHDLGTTNVLQKMSVNGSEAIITGYGNTFLKSTDNGDTWNQLDMVRPVFDYTDLSICGDVGYMIAGREKLYDAREDVYAEGVIYKTLDGGTTWIELDLNGLGEGSDPTVDPNADKAYGYYFQSIECVNDTIALCGLKWKEYGGVDHSAVFKTTNGGLNWTNITGDLEGNSVTTISVGDSTAYIGGSDIFLKVLLKGGEPLDLIANLVDDSKAFISEVELITDTSFYVSTTRDGAYISNDSGSSFSKYETLGSIGGWDILPVNDTTLVLVGGKNNSRVSTDNGASWNDCLLDVLIWDIAGVFNDSLNILSQDSIYKIATTDLIDGNYNWKTKMIGDGNLQKAHIYDDYSMLVVGNSQIAKITNDGGLSWDDVELPYIAGWDDDIDFNNLSSRGDIAYACFNRIKLVDYPASSENNDIYYSGGIFYTNDNWETWNDIDMAKIGLADETDVTRNPNHPDCYGLNPQVIECLNEDTLLVYARWYNFTGTEKAEHSRIFKTNDNGKNWYVVSEDFSKKYVQDIKFDGDTGYVVGKQLFQKSVDGGESFVNMYAKLDEGEDDAMYISEVLLGDENEVFLTTISDSIWRSIDGGESFLSFVGPVGANDFYKFDINSYMILGNSTKSYFTNDEGETWENCATPSTTFEIGGVYGEKVYALAKGKYYTLPVSSLDLKVWVHDEILANEVRILYGDDRIVVASDKNIDKCYVYNLSGQLISVKEPNNDRCIFQNSSFTPGIYIISSSIRGKRYTDKVVFR